MHAFLLFLMKTVQIALLKHHDMLNAVVLGMWCAAGRHADAGVGIGMPALVFVKNMDGGYDFSQKKRVFAVFVFCKKFQKKEVFFSKIRPAGGKPENTTTNVS